LKTFQFCSLHMTLRVTGNFYAEPLESLNTVWLPHSVARLIVTLLLKIWQIYLWVGGHGAMQFILLGRESLKKMSAKTKSNGLIDTDPQQHKAALPHVFRSGHLQRWAS
jgi:hypothetical protein